MLLWCNFGTALIWCNYERTMNIGLSQFCLGPALNFQRGVGQIRLGNDIVPIRKRYGSCGQRSALLLAPEPHAALGSERPSGASRGIAGQASSQPWSTLPM